MIFSQAAAQDSLSASTSNRKRATSAAPNLRGAPVPKLLQFNAKDTN
jgi:hypothetical protein